MQIETNTAIHNRFDVEVVNATTGAVRQRAVAYNLVLDKFFEYRLKDFRTANLVSGIAVGSGTGTLAVTRTALFSQRIVKSSAQDSFVANYPTSYVQRSIRIETTECNGYDLTEVGVTYDRPYFGHYLVTHALLQDSEGNPIVIQKTENDVVIVKSIVYCTFTPGGFGTNAEYPDAASNKVVRWLLLGETFDRVCFSRWNRPLHKLSFGGLVGNNAVGQRSGELSISMAGGSTARWQQGYLDLPVVQWNDNVQIPRLVSTLGVPGVGAAHLPDPDVFPLYEVSALPIGTGDGETTAFNIRAPLIVPNSESIFVNGVLLTRGTDYEIDYESHCDNDLRHAWTQQYQCIDANVQFGSYSIRSTKGPYNGYYDPAVEGAYCIENDHPAGQYSPTSITINETTPIRYDFGQARGCNQFTVLSPNPPETVFTTMQILVSDNNTDWTPVTGLVRDGTCVSFPLTSARYWKLYPTTSWTYTLAIHGVAGSTLPGPAQLETAVFFLGKWVPGLTFITPPASGAAITASYQLDRPYHTGANLLRFTFSIRVQRE
jgi:hypothetical protein